MSDYFTSTNDAVRAAVGDLGAKYDVVDLAPDDRNGQGLLNLSHLAPGAQNPVSVVELVVDEGTVDLLSEEDFDDTTIAGEAEAAAVLEYEAESSGTNGGYVTGKVEVLATFEYRHEKAYSSAEITGVRALQKR